MRRDPRETERALRAVAASQAGYFTAGQALENGYTYRQQHFHRERGNWHVVDRGIYRYPDYPDSPNEDLVRWALWSRTQKGRVQAVVSHESALVVHDLGDVMPGKLHLTVPPSFRKPVPGGAVLHRSHLAEADVEHKPGFLVTTPLRTLVDVAQSPINPAQLRAAVRDAMNRGLVRRGRLIEAKLPPAAKEHLREALAAVAAIAR